MSRTRMEHVKNNFIWGIIANLVSIIFQFVLRTIFLVYLSSAYLGLNSLCVSILSVINLANLGLTGAFVFKLYKPIAEHDIPEIRKLVSLFRKVYIYLGLFIFFIGICILPFLEFLIKSDIPENVNVHIIFLMYLLQNVLGFVVYGYKELILMAEQRTDINNMITSCVFGCMYIVQTIFVVNQQYFLYVFIMPVSTVILGFVRAYIVDSKYPEYKYLGIYDKRQMKEILREVISISIYKIRDLSRNSLDSVVISSFLGLSILADYQNYYMILSIPILIRSIVCGSVIPSLGNFVATRSKSDVYNLYIKMAYWIVYISGWFAICYGCLIQDCIKLWIGEKYLMSEKTVLLLVILFYVLGYSILNMTVRETTGIYKYGRKMAILEIFANLIFNILFVFLCGINGVILATIITILFFSLPYEFYVIHKIYFDKSIYLILKLGGRAFIESIIVAIITFFVCNLVGFYSIWTFIIKCVICSLMPPLIFGVLHHRDAEMKEVLRRIIDR